MQKSRHDAWVGLFVVIGAAALLFLALQNTDADTPQPTDLRTIGTIGAIRQMAKSPGGGIHRAIVSHEITAAARDRRRSTPGRRGRAPPGPPRAPPGRPGAASARRPGA